MHSTVRPSTHSRVAQRGTIEGEPLVKVLQVSGNYFDRPFPAAISLPRLPVAFPPAAWLSLGTAVGFEQGEASSAQLARRSDSLPQCEHHLRDYEY